MVAVFGARGSVRAHAYGPQLHARRFTAPAEEIIQPSRVHSPPLIERTVVGNTRHLCSTNERALPLAVQAPAFAQSVRRASTALVPNTTVERTAQQLRCWVRSGLRPTPAAHLRRWAP